MEEAVARQRVRWCNRSVEWMAVPVDQTPDGPNAVWSYRLDELTYYSFAYDPEESGSTTRVRALNWLNRHHLIVRREHLMADLPTPMR